MIAFVGKGIAFDSGGLSLKPADGIKPEVGHGRRRGIR
jgi:leucyl aminopeptidase